MIAAPLAIVRDRADRVVAALRTAGVEADVVESEASVGGGAFPAARLPSFAVAPAGDANAFELAARTAPVPIVGRIADRRFLLDMRTILRREEDAFVRALTTALAHPR
jgi:L-seryl-tRNA(Ser) seleniumtransferase